jgi:hypothetical protein
MFVTGSAGLTLSDPLDGCSALPPDDTREMLHEQHQ